MLVTIDSATAEYVETVLKVSLCYIRESLINDVNLDPPDSVSVTTFEVEAPVYNDHVVYDDVKSGDTIYIQKKNNGMAVRVTPINMLTGLCKASRRTACVSMKEPFNALTNLFHVIYQKQDNNIYVLDVYPGREDIAPVVNVEGESYYPDTLKAAIVIGPDEPYEKFIV